MQDIWQQRYLQENDKNDARGIAQMMRAGLFKEVLVKSDESCQIKIALGSRRQLTCSKHQIIGTIRGLLWGKTWSRCQIESFSLKVQKAISSLDKISRNSIEELIRSLEAIEESI